MKARQGHGTLTGFVLPEQRHVGCCLRREHLSPFRRVPGVHVLQPSRSLPAQGSRVTWLRHLGVRKKRNFLLAELELVPSRSS